MPTGSAGKLAITFLLTAAFFVVELVVGLISGSLALVADAGHMATDVLALGASLVATQMAGRPTAPAVAPMAAIGRRSSRPGSPCC